MSLSALFAFALILSVGVATPGPTVLLAMSNGSRYGLRHAMVGMLGAVTADVVLVALVGLGLGVLLDASETAFVTLKLLGAAWLAYVGIRMLMSRGSPADAQVCVPATPDRRTAFLKSFFVAMSNPKYYLFMSALLPQFVDRSHAIAPQYAILAATIVAVDVIGMTGYALLGVHSVRVWKVAGEKWLNRVSGSLLLMLAGYVALYRKATH
ncbi:MAG: LysE family translocator [Burkholderia sp.]|uniref:LysE family translocator n=2 Tax=Burkholderia sp. TaxID=36773 RepID=UPI002587231F|nr:LysE family translocator [Burkholderia sp.]MCA3782913.1 LysE family translocator [Burkholderia sp.]MCA3792033.1 LysE family translocator [Burkholderia sp.]MCA3811527.1 LysE family translocator [Burkholderia sp.]MCA3821196.1 LysE family translocator [Burkholderia sp.]MCA3823882.1 LysE family translocator [Burkholderia sp.]